MLSAKKGNLRGRFSMLSIGSADTPKNDRRQTANYEDLLQLQKELLMDDSDTSIIQNSWIKSTEKITGKASGAKTISRRSSRSSVNNDHNKENIVQAKVSSARSKASSRNDLSDFDINKTGDDRRHTVDIADLKLLLSPTLSSGRSSVAGNRRDTLDTQDLLDFQRELEDSVSISPTAKAESKVITGVVAVSSTNPVDISDISFASSANVHATNVSSSVVPAAVTVADARADRRETADPEAMAKMLRDLDDSTATSAADKSVNKSRLSLRNKASKNSATTPLSSSRSIRSLRSNSSMSGNNNKSRNVRRTTIDTADMDWMLNGGLDTSSAIYTDSSHALEGKREQQYDSMMEEASRVSSKASKASAKSGNGGRKSNSSSKRGNKSKATTPASSVGDSSPASSVATMDTMNVADKIRGMLEDEDDLESERVDEERDNDGSMSTMDMDRSPAITIGTLEANTSMGTINTLDLLGAVEDALEEAAAMNEDTDDDTSSLLGLQDLLNRNRQSSPEEHQQQQAKKRKSRSSPAANASQAASDSPALQRNRMFSPEPVTSKGNAMVVSTPSFALRPDQINSVLNHSIANESFTLKSCFSARKAQFPPSATKSHNKSVIFGSPDVAEFNKLSPVGRFTPMDKSEAKKMFLMQVDEASEKSEDEVTAENSRVLEEWDRLSSVGDGSYDGSDEELEVQIDPYAMDIEEVDKENAAPMEYSMRRNNSRRRLSRLQPLLDLAAVEEPSNVSAEESGYGHTVELPANLADLVEQNEQPSNLSAMSEYDATVEMEANLHDLMRAVGGVHGRDSFASTSQNDDSRASSQGYNPLGMMAGQISFISSNAETGSDTSGRLSLLEGRPSTYPVLLVAGRTSDASLPLPPPPPAPAPAMQSTAGQGEGEEGAATMEDVQEVFEYAEDDMHEMDQSASFAQSVLIASDEDISSNASTLPDENHVGANSFVHELSFVETKRRILFGNTMMADSNRKLASQTPVHSSQQSVDESNALLRRIQQLKEGSRVNSLAQSMTPAGPRRPSMGQQRLSMMQQANAGIASNGTINKRLSLPKVPAPVVTRSTKKAPQTQESFDEDTIEQGTPSSKGDLSSDDIAEQLLLPERSMIMHEDDKTTTTPFTADVDIRGNLHKFYDVTQAVQEVVQHMDSNLQGVAYDVMLETFASATKCLCLGFENVPIESMLKMAWEMVDASVFVDAAYDLSVSQYMGNNVLLLTDTEGWEQVWMNLVTAAMLSLSDGMQEQLRKVRGTDDDESIFSGLDQSRFLGKVLDRSTISSSSTSGRQSTCDAVNEFLRQLAVEQTEVMTNQATARAAMKDNAEEVAAFDAAMLVRIANRVPYIRLQTFQEECIEVNINLTETSMVMLRFIMEVNEQGHHDVLQTEMELRFPAASELQEGEDKEQRLIRANENALVAAYFRNVISSEQGQAPLSRSMLNGIAAAAQIPGLLEQISSYVVALRQFVLFLRKLSLIGGLFMVEQEGSTLLHMDLVGVLEEALAIDIKLAMTIVQMNFEKLSLQSKDEVEQQKVLTEILHCMETMLQVA